MNPSTVLPFEKALVSVFIAQLTVHVVYHFRPAHKLVLNENLRKPEIL